MMKFPATLPLTLLCLTLHAESFAADKSPDVKSNVGTSVANFRLQDYRGKSHKLSDCKDSKLVVVAFLGTDCPLAKLYGLRLGQLHKQYESKGVAFFGVNSNCNDSVTEVAAHADKHRITFPVLKDVGNKLADAMAAKRTPEVFLLDEKRVIRYRGRIDDQYGIGYTRDRADHPYLVNAIEQLLAGKPVSVPVTEPEGCLIARVLKPQSDSKVTYTKDIAPILHKRCVECHRTGEIAPFTLTSYKDASGWAEMIREVVRERRMPPWHADPKHGKFLNERYMSKQEIALIEEWVKNGAPRGEKSNVTLPPIKTIEGWSSLPKKPDAVIAMRETPYSVPAEGSFRRNGARRGIPYRHFVVDPGFKEDKWIRAAEVVPGNRKVVHHILVIVRPPGARSKSSGIGGGEFLAGYVPGLRGMPAPKGAAKFVPAGSKLIFQLHYTPIGSEQTDLSKIGLVFADPKDVKQVVVTTRAANAGFKIPANDPNHEVKATTGSLPYDVKLLAFMPHMHLRGKSFRYEARYPDGRTETLLDVPAYDFNWQTRYILAEPKTMPAGTRIHAVAHFDNSKYNLNNPDPSRTVGWGDQTWDEMMIGYFDILIPRDKFEQLRKSIKKASPADRVAAVIRRFDSNGDGKLAKKEVPERMARLFDRLDRNKDGFVTAEELKRIANLLGR